MGTVRGLTPESTRIVDRVCSITQPARNEGADTQHELLQGCHPSPDTRVCDFTLIDWNDHNQEPDAEPGYSPPTVEPFDSLRGGLEASANDEDDAPDEDGPFASHIVTGRTGEPGTEERSACE